MRDSFQDGGPALVPKTAPRSCTQGSHEENEPAAAHGLQHGLKLEMELTLAPAPLRPCISVAHGPLPWGRRPGDSSTAATAAPMEFTQEADPRVSPARCSWACS